MGKLVALFRSKARHPKSGAHSPGHHGSMVNMHCPYAGPATDAKEMHERRVDDYHRNYEKFEQMKKYLVDLHENPGLSMEMNVAAALRRYEDEVVQPWNPRW